MFDGDNRTPAFDTNAANAIVPMVDGKETVEPGLAPREGASVFNVRQSTTVNLSRRVKPQWRKYGRRRRRGCLINEATRSLATNDVSAQLAFAPHHPASNAHDCQRYPFPQEGATAIAASVGGPEATCRSSTGAEPDHFASR
jgi:hypothetical protein